MIASLILDMFPRFPIYYFPNGRSLNPIFFSHFPDRSFLFNISSPYFFNNFFRQFRVFMNFSEWLSSIPEHIISIFLLSSEVEMVRIHAIMCSAFMKNIKFSFDFSIMENPRSAMCRHAPMSRSIYSNIKSSMSKCIAFCPSPKPACRSFFYLFYETIYWFSGEPMSYYHR